MFGRAPAPPPRRENGQGKGKDDGKGKGKGIGKDKGNVPVPKAPAPKAKPQAKPKAKPKAKARAKPKPKAEGEEGEAKPKRDTARRHWVFTKFNWTEEEEQQLLAWNQKNGGPVPDHVIQTYIAFGREICPDTGRPHLQGYLELEDKIRHSQLREWWPGFFFAARKGTVAEAGDYAKKDGDGLSRRRTAF